MKKLIVGIILIIAFSCNQEKESSIINVLDYGVIGDGKTLNTKAIQNALDKASEVGGSVYFPAGKYISGTIFIKSNTIVEFSPQAFLLGSPNIEDYTEMTWGHNKDRQPYHLIVIQNAENVKITGLGTIDGQGENFWKEENAKNPDGSFVVPRWIMAKDKKVSPLIEITGSKNIIVEEVTIKTGGGWNLHIHDCDLVKVDKANIINNLYSPNSDGIDITGSFDVTVSNCYIKTCDDAVCLKTVPDSRECRRVTVTNCLIETLCVGLKLGCNESFKDMSDVTFSNCVVNKSSRAVGLYVREGAVYDNILISNIVSNTNAPLIFNRPIQVMVEQRDSTSKKGGIRNLSISNFTSTSEGRILLTAQEGTFIENVTLRDVSLRFPYIEDPLRYAGDAGSSQFPKNEYHPEVLGARAAIVAENITNLVVDNFQTWWPNAEVPTDWQHPERIENGSQRIHKPDYSNPRHAEFSFLWGRGLKGGFLNAPLASSSDKSMKKYDLVNSDIEIMR